MTRLKSWFVTQQSIWLPLCCLLLIVVVSFSVYPDYSISGDGIWIRTIGGRNALQINEKLDYAFFSKEHVAASISQTIGEERNSEIDSLTNSFETLPNDKFHGVWFEFVLIGSEFLLADKDWQNIYFTRHLITHAYFLGALICFYLLLLQLFENWKVALFGSLMLLLSPRIYAHSFFNSKDLAFLSAYWIAIWAMFRYLKKPSYRTILLFGISTGMAIALRILGIFIPVLFLAILFLKMCVATKNKELIQQQLLQLVVFISSLIGCTILFWPVLWDAPFQRFFEGFSMMKKYPWEGHFLFNGGLITLNKSAPPPWFYAPLWILYTTPIAYLFGFLLSIRLFFKYQWTCFFSPKHVAFQWLIFYGLFFMPLLAVIYFKSIIYGDWRHLYFVYPALVVLATYGFYETYLCLKPKLETIIFGWRKGIIPTLILSISLMKMISLHPFEHSYFNNFAGDNLEGKWEIDIWSLSFPQALKKIIKLDERPVITIFTEDSAVPSTYILTPEQRQKIRFVDKIEAADYFIATYFARPDRVAYLKEKDLKMEDMYFEIKAGGHQLLSVFKLKE